MGIFSRKIKKPESAGLLGEKAAAKYLKSKGYEILETNFSNPLGRRLGEIDIIARYGEEIIFVEVKTREAGSSTDCLPEEKITPAKLRKLNKAGQFYIKSKNLWDCAYRFDAISVWMGDEWKQAKIKHIESIFY